MAFADLWARIRTATLMVAALAGLFLFAEFSCLGHLALQFTLLAAGALCSYEAASICVKSDNRKKFVWLGLILAPMLILFIWGILNFGLCYFEWRPARGLAVTLVASLASALFCTIWLIVVRQEPQDLEKIKSGLLTSYLSILLVGAGGASLVGLSGLDNSISILTWLLLVVCSNDIAAYFGGRLLQGPKLSPLVSPGKTVSGSLCGLIVGALVGLVFQQQLPFANGFIAILLTLLILIGAQLGDLCESLLKRVASVKDSGTLLPGHGGLLDRADAVLGASIVLYVWIFWNSWL